MIYALPIVLTTEPNILYFFWVRQATLICLLVLNKDPYVNGVWSGVHLRSDTKRTIIVFIWDWTIRSTFVKHSRLNSQYNQEENIYDHSIKKTIILSLTMGKIFIWAPNCLRNGYMHNSNLLVVYCISYKKWVQNWTYPFKTHLPYTIQSYHNMCYFDVCSS